MGNLHLWDSTPRSYHMFPLSEQPAVSAPLPKPSQPPLPDTSHVALPGRLPGRYAMMRFWVEKKGAGEEQRKNTVKKSQPKTG